MATEQGAPHLSAAAYDRFAVVLYGSPAVIAAVQAIRDQLPLSGRPILPGHVTVKGTFIDPVNLDQTAETIREIAARHAPIAVAADACRARVDGPYCGVWLDVEHTRAIHALHDELVRTLADHGKTIYAGEAEGRFRAHLTIVEEVPAEQEAAILATIERFDHRFAWTAREVALVGRRGGAAWETLTTPPLLGKRDEECP